MKESNKTSSTMNGYGCRKSPFNPLPWLFPIIFILILTFMFIVWNRSAKDSYTLQDYSYVYEMSVSGGLNRQTIISPLAIAASNSSVSPLKDQSKAKASENKHVHVDSAPLKPPQNVEVKGKTAEEKLMADSKNLQVTNRTIREEKGNTVVGGDGKNAESSESSEEDDVPIIFGITPTYKRNTQKVDLTSLCQTLLLVPRVMWIVVEDAVEKSDLVKNFLQRCKVESVHMNVKTPPKQKSRGVLQRNAGLNWIRKRCTETKCNGVVYFMDDDNKYDLRLFEEMRKTQGVSVFPVAFSGNLAVEGPVCENGKAVKWIASFAPQRSLPIDMAGFAVNVDLILKHRNAVIGKNKNGKASLSGYLEPDFLEQLCTRETVECRGQKEVMVWHTKTQARVTNDNAPKEGYEV